jgi:aspartate oxidase
MLIFKDTTYHNYIKYETIKVMKSFMNSNLGIIKNNNLLNPISEYINEITQQQDEPPPNTNKKSPKKTKSPNKK